jgi:hypothetical protein
MTYWRILVLLQSVNLAIALTPGNKERSEVSPQILGTVLEVGTDRPIAGVEVQVALQADRHNIGVLLPGNAAQDAITSQTGVDGRFSVNLPNYGTYRALVRKEGWGAAISLFEMSPNLKIITVTEETPHRELNFWLARPATIIGRALDASSGAPISTGLMAAWQMAYREGVQVAAFPAEFAFIAADGKFKFNYLPPGRYAFVMIPEKRGAARIIRDSSDKEVDIVEKGYEPTFWPGGLDSLSVVPLNLVSGAYESLGDLKLKPVDLYRVSGEVSGCEPGEQLWLYETRSNTSVGERIGAIDCGKRFLLTGMPPGAYRLRLFGKQSHKRGSEDISIKDKSLRLVSNVTPGGDLHVQVTASDTSKKPVLEGIGVELRPLPADPEEQISGRVNENGNLTLSGVAIGNSHIEIRGMPDGYYVKHILCNGTPLLDDAILRYDGGINPTSLTVVIDDKPGAITGTVRRADKLVSNPLLVLARWPVVGNIYHSVVTRTGSEDGKFEFTGLPEGDYRLAAVPSAQRESLQRPSILERVLARGEKVRVASGVFQNATLNETDVDR